MLVLAVAAVALGLPNGGEETAELIGMEPTVSPEPSPEPTPEATPEPTPEPTADPTPEPTPGSTPEPTGPREEAVEATVLVSEATIPGDEPADQFADIATDPDGAEAVWERFGLSGKPVETDFSRSVLLVLGFGESGTCPRELDGVVAGADRVRVSFGIDGVDEDEQVACTHDYNPRTFVLEANRTMIPERGFVLELDQGGTRYFVLAGTATGEPPAGPSMTWVSAREDADLSLTPDPAVATDGQTVELVLANHGEVTAFSSSGGGPRTAALQRWDRQRWLPAPRQEPYDRHPALTLNDVEVEPGERAAFATVDTSELAPAWYRVDASISLRGYGGRVDVVAAFRVDDAG